jgi:hypothetical protein
MLLNAIPRLRLIRHITSSKIFGNRFIPGIGDKVDFSRYSSAPASMSFWRFFALRLLSTTTEILLVAESFFNCLSTSGPLIFGKIISSKISSGCSALANLSADSPSLAQTTS